MPPNLRVLVVVGGASTDRPSSGVVMRRHHLLRAAARVGTLDVFVTTKVNDATLDEMSSMYGARVGCAHSAVVPSSPAGRFLRYLRRPAWPARIARADCQALRRDLRSWMASYDLTIVELIDDFMLLAQILSGPVVVDHDDRESDVMAQVRSRRRSADERRPRGGISGTALHLLRKTAWDLYLAIEHYRWVRAERFVVRRADSVLVASSDDVPASGNSPKAVVVPNGFELAGAPVGSRDVNTPPTISFWGLMSYVPNRRGAEWLLAEVLPRLTGRIPNLRAVIIGSGSEQLRVPDDGRVVLTGFVEDLSVWLSQADVAVVPLLVGGGTRIKIIEAWANNIPVVSTWRGAYGLGAVHGENLLLADDPEDFARAIALTLEDFSVRDRLIEKGAERARALTWSRIEKDLSDHLARLAFPGVSR